MKCPYCGAENVNSKYCEFCGSQISAEVQKEQERLNKKGCPSCGSTNIAFTREKQGEYRGRSGSAVLRSTVGLCKDCGYTWNVDNYGGMSDRAPTRKRKTWLWVLGWLFLFPLPLTILLLRKKKMNPIAKYGIIAVAWVIYFVIGLSGNSSEAKEQNTGVSVPYVEETGTNEDDFELEIIAGDMGDYGREMTLNAGTEFEDTTIGYFVPTGVYTVENTGETMTQVNIYKDEISVTSEGWEEWSDGESELIDVGESKEMTVEDGYFINVDAPAHIAITKIG